MKVVAARNGVASKAEKATKKVSFSDEKLDVRNAAQHGKNLTAKSNGDFERNYHPNDWHFLKTSEVKRNDETIFAGRRRSDAG